MQRICLRCPSAAPCSLLLLRTARTRSISITRPRWGGEGTSPRAKALEVYQLPKSNIPGKTLLTQPATRNVRDAPQWLVQLGMKLFRSSWLRKSTSASTAKIAMQEYYALCATRATSDGDETSTGLWYDELGLQPSFATWFQITALHVYMLHARLRCYPAKTANMCQQMLIDSFFEDIEMRIYYEYNIKSQRYIQTQMKEFYENFRGLMVAYDEGLTKNDAVLAAAFWRNIFQHSPTTVDFEKLAKVLNYFWKNMKLLDLSGQEAFQKGEFGFLSPDRTPPGMEWQPNYEDLGLMLQNIKVREMQWAIDKVEDMKAIGWDYSKPLNKSESELPTLEDVAWDKERAALGFADFPAIPPPEDADEVLAEEFARRKAKAEKKEAKALGSN